LTSVKACSIFFWNNDMMNRSVRTILLLLILAALLAGCAQKIPVANLPDGLAIQYVGRVSSDSPIVWHPDGYRYAVAAGGLKVWQLDGAQGTVDSNTPSAIAWSPTGFFLSATYAGQEKSEVKIFDSDGAVLADLDVAGSVRDLAWASDDELLMASVTVTSYNFGANYNVSLYRWRQNEEMTSEVLADTSPLKQDLEAIGKAIYDSVHLRISPYRDEILFTRLVMPPNVDMHYQLILRHLDSGREKIVTKSSYRSSGGRYLQQEDRLFYSDGQYQSILGSIWGTEAYETFQPGMSVEVSPGGRYKLIDRDLLCDRELLVSLTDVDQAAFSPDGARLLFSSGRSLFLISGLEDAPIKRRKASPRLLELRRWRSEGLLSPLDFNKYVEKLDKE
jgi:hypothetical protein